MKFLLGGTTDGQLIMAEVKNDNYFGVSFDVLRPIRATDETVKNYIQALVDDTDTETLYRWCCDYDCKPSDLVDYLIDDEDIETLLDCPDDPETMIIDD